MHILQKTFSHGVLPGLSEKKRKLLRKSNIENPESVREHMEKTRRVGTVVGPGVIGLAPGGLEMRIIGLA